MGSPNSLGPTLGGGGGTAPEALAISPLLGVALGAGSTSTTIGATNAGGGVGTADFPTLGTTATSEVPAAFAAGAELPTASAGGAAAADGTRVSSWSSWWW